MICLSREKRHPFVLLLLMSMIVILMMSYFGFRLKGFRPTNQVQWSDSGLGITFKRFAVAYTQGFLTSTGSLESSDWTIECAIEPVFAKYSKFRFILLVHDGRDDHQLLVGQWQSSLIIMNGNDYRNRRKDPRISVQLDENAGKPQLVTIVSGALGTTVYLDGQLKKQDNALTLKWPERVEQAKLVLGNNVYGDHPWTGKIGGLALYDRALTTGKIRQHFHTWSSGNDFKPYRQDVPQLLYAFDEGQGNRVRDRIGAGVDLWFPAWMNPLRKSVLSWPKIEDYETSSLIRDVIANLLGFIPLGFILMATLGRLQGVGNRTLYVAVVIFAFCFSLLIEIVQVWIPSRDSSSLDLLLNTSGCMIGIVLFNAFRTRLNGSS